MDVLGDGVSKGALAPSSPVSYYRDESPSKTCPRQALFLPKLPAAPIWHVLCFSVKMIWVKTARLCHKLGTRV